MGDQIPVTFYVNGSDSNGSFYFSSLTKFVNVVPKGFLLSKSQGGFIGEGLGLKNVSNYANFTV
jgi:hypothetical protein